MRDLCFIADATKEDAEALRRYPVPGFEDTPMTFGPRGGFAT